MRKTENNKQWNEEKNFSFREGDQDEWLLIDFWWYKILCKSEAKNFHFLFFLGNENIGKQQQYHERFSKKFKRY